MRPARSSSLSATGGPAEAASWKRPNPGTQQLNGARRWRARTRNPGEQPDRLVGRHGNVVRRAPDELGCSGFGDALHAAKPNNGHRYVLIRYPFGTGLGPFGPFMQG